MLGFFPREMLCQVFTAAAFTSCLFLGSFSFNFDFSKWNAAPFHQVRWLTWPLPSISASPCFFLCSFSSSLFYLFIFFTLTNGLYLGLNHLYVFSRLLTLTQISLPSLGHSWSRQLLWSRCCLPGKGNSCDLRSVRVCKKSAIADIQ